MRRRRRLKSIALRALQSALHRWLEGVYFDRAARLSVGGTHRPAPPQCLDSNGRLMQVFQRHVSGHRVYVVLLYALMLAAAAAVGFFRIYSQYAADDEGYVMISVRSFLDGRPLYDQVYSQYGPFYYLYKAALHRLSGLPVTHDTVRLMTIGAWLLATLFCSLFSYRITRSLLVAAAVFLFTFRSLWMLCIDPGHPQELCALLLAGGVYLSSFADSADRLRWVLPGLGAIAAALALTKINCGLYFCMALAGAMVSFAESRWFRRMAGSLLVAATIFLPICLMWPHLDMEKAQIYSAIAAGSCLSATSVAMVRNQREIRLIDFAAPFAGFAVTLILVLGAMAVCGSTAAGLWDGIVSGPLRFSGQFALLPAALQSSEAILAIVATVAALAYCLCYRGLLQLSDRVSVALVAMGILIRSAMAIEVVSVLAIFLVIEYLPAFVTPWIWLTLADPSQKPPTLSNAFGRTMVVLAAAFLVLYAYPVASAQWSTASFLIVPATGICAHDVWLCWQRSRFRSPARFAVAGATFGFILLALQWWSLCRSFAVSYRDLTPLNLPGAQWLRLREYEVAVLRCLSVNLRDNCDTFFGAPSINSLYFWSGLKPPTDFNPGLWMMLLDEKQKRAVFDELVRHPRAWFVYDPTAIKSWRGGFIGSHADDPLERYCQTHFEPMVQVGAYDLCVPVGATHPLLEEAANVSSLPASVSSQFRQLGMPSDSSPNVMIQPRLKLDRDRQPGLARVIVVDAADGKLLSDSNDTSIRGMKVLDADLRPVKLPLPPGWNENPQLGALHLVPYQRWESPKEHDYSKVLVGLVDEHGELIVWLPLAIPLEQAKR